MGVPAAVELGENSKTIICLWKVTGNVGSLRNGRMGAGYPVAVFGFDFQIIVVVWMLLGGMGRRLLVGSQPYLVC